MKGRREMPRGRRGDVAGRSDHRLFHGYRARGDGAPDGFWARGGGHRSTRGVIEGVLPLRPGWCWMSPTRPPPISAVAAILRRHGRIDVLLNNAGCAVREVVEEVPGAAVPATVDVNIFRGSAARSLLSATTRRATLSDGKGGDHLGLSRRSARAPLGEPIRVMPGESVGVLPDRWRC